MVWCEEWSLKCSSQLLGHKSGVEYEFTGPILQGNDWNRDHGPAPGKLLVLEGQRHGSWAWPLSPPAYLGRSC